MRKTLAIIMMIAMVFCYMPLTGFADTEVSTTSVNTSGFIDMPNNWSTEALSKAVGNGLLEGFKEKSGTFIKPSDPLTRAQMATIVNRAFGAKGTANLTGVKDVPQKAWYTAEMQKAVKMGTMKLDSKMRPNDPITRQEAFTVLARAFKMADGTMANLEKFSDKEKVSSWAVSSLGALARVGYIQGADGKLNPLSKITRAEFAVVMDNMIKEYINKAGTVTQVHEGNLMINVPDVILKDITVKGDLILGDGIGEGNVTLENVIVKGNLIARGGGVNSIIIVGGGVDGKIVIAKVDGQVRVSVEGGAEVEVIVIDDGKDDVIIEGTVGTVEVTAPDTPVIVQNATVTNIEIKSVGAANVTVDSGSTVTNVVVGTGSTGTTLNVEGRVTNVETSAANTNVGGTGTVTTVTTNEGANNTSVTTPSTKVNNDGATGVTAGGGTEVPSGSTATNSNTGGEATVVTTPTGGGSTGSGSGSGDTVVNVSAISVTGTGGVTTVVNGSTLQMIAAVTPDNATSKTVTWSVTNVTGTATIDASTGLLTATGVGTVTVKATNAASGVVGTKDITVSAAPLAVTVSKLATAPNDANKTGSQANQDAVTVTQTGNVVTVSGNLADMKSFASTNLAQGSGKWVGLVVATGETSIIGVKYGAYDFAQDDVDEANSVNAPAGSFVLWIKANEVVTSPKTFTLTKAGMADTTVTVNFTDPTAQDNLDIAAAKTAIESATYAAAQADVADADAAKTKAQALVDALGAALEGTTVVVVPGDFTAATAGDATTPNGTNGSYTFTVTINKGLGTQAISDTLTMTITATAYDSTAQDNADIADAKAAIEGATYIAAQVDAEDAGAALIKAQALVDALGADLKGTTATVVAGTFNAAVAGTSGTPAGTNGSYTFTVTIAKGSGTQETSAEQTMTITATAYVPSNIATVTSGTYTVSAGGTASETITNVPSGTAKATFLAALTKGQADQTWNDTGINDPVVSDDTLVVTAQDGATTVTYTVTVNAPLSNVVNTTQSIGYDTIQEAITEAGDGNTIQVYAGTYNEALTIANKSLTLTGTDGAIISGGLIANATSTGKTITVSDLEFTTAGLEVNGYDSVTISDNTFTNITSWTEGQLAEGSADAIYVHGSETGTAMISGNTITGVHCNTTNVGDGMGITVLDLDNITITGNAISDTWHNSINIYQNVAGTVAITNNTLSNWDSNRDAADDATIGVGCEGGRALRIDLSAGATITVTGNTITPNDDTDRVDDEYVKITGVNTETVDSLIIQLRDDNTWTGDPVFADVILVNSTTIASYNGPVTGQITADGSGLVNGALNFKGTNDLVIVGQVTGTGNLTTFSGTVSGSINGTITAQINANGIDTLSGTITPSSGVVDGTIRIIGIFGQTGIDGDFEGEIITGPVPTYVETLEITSAAGSTVTVGHTLQLGINVTPEAASAEVAWSVYVNDREKGSIDENGLFTATAEGTVTVIAKALDGSLKDDTYVVTVQTLETEAIAAINAGEATLQDYENAGIIGLSAGNLTDVNTAVATAKATKGSDLIKEEIQGVVASVVDAADQLLLARVNASQLRITDANQAVDTIGDMLTGYFNLTAEGDRLTEIVSIFWFNNYHYQNKFTFASLEAVVSALSAVETEYAKIIATFQGTEGGYATNVKAVESYIASAARLAATSSSPGRTVADEIVELAPMYAAGIIGADNLINDAYEEMMNGIDGTGIDTLAEFFAAFQAALEAAASGD